MRTITVAVDDDAVYGAEDGYSVDAFRFSAEDIDLLTVEVPDDIAAKLVVHGTSDQWFSDGYVALDAVAPYL